VPDLILRTRSAGMRGIYVPAMEVHHHVAAGRLTPRYFRRWWFGKGVSRASLERTQPVTELGIDLRNTPHLLGVPRYMYGSAIRDAVGTLRERLAGRPQASFRHQMMVVYCAGYFWARWREHRTRAAGTQHSPIESGPR
jgi:hypothetical protein